ncbi:hypothetical protein Glove_12g23 [Diversispora epigaea]|uniref:Uncharacterized protein n=1 Tax=Diversispora epigaea TaxID=1348612 RepID=A0A397JS41_9GLOM|nr:hypothetical protein Glove_12g23 [Diversispora epigaea]
MIESNICINIALATWTLFKEIFDRGMAERNLTFDEMCIRVGVSKILFVASSSTSTSHHVEMSCGNWHHHIQ